MKLKCSELRQETKPKIPHLVSPLMSDNEDYHALVRFGETRDDPNFGNPSLKVISHTF